MVKNHARKNAARAVRESDGGNHRQAVDALSNADRLVCVVDLPPPDLAGARPCPDCHGTGDGDVYQEETTDGSGDQPPLLVPEVCRSCGGCGRADHDRCRTGWHVGDEPDAYEWSDLDDDEHEDGPCSSCWGRRFLYVGAYGIPDDRAEAAHAELLERARTHGMDEWQLMGAAAWGRLDEALGPGAQDLAEAADTTSWLRAPCACADAAVRTIRLSELR